MKSLERVFTNHLKFFCLILRGGGREGVVFLFVSLAIFFPLLPSVDQMWLVHYFGAISSSLTPLVAADALEILPPTKGQDTLLPWGHDLCFIPDLLIAWVAPETVFPKWQPNMLLKACQMGVTFLSKYTLSKLMYVFLLKCWSKYFYF